MVWLRMILIIGVLSISACASSKGIEKKNSHSMTMLDIYSNSQWQAQQDVSQFVEQHLQEQKTFGYVKPYIPVINEPVVRKVWIPDHKSEDNADVMIAGHWVYVMIQPSTWFIEGKSIDATMPVIVPAVPEAN